MGRSWGLSRVSLFTQKAPTATEVRSGAWGLDALAGRFVELRGAAGAAALTLAARLLLQAQQAGEPVVWLGHTSSLFFPPDFAAAGLDLQALPVVRAQDGRELARMADTLLRSGAFSVVVLDLDERMYLNTAMQARLAGLAKTHQTVLLGITRKRCLKGQRWGGGDRGASSTLGSMVSLRGETSLQRADFDRFTCQLHIIKDKLGGPGWHHTEVCRGPDGLC